MPKIPSKDQRMLQLWGQALDEFQQIQASFPELPIVPARAALFYGFQRSMFLTFKTLKAFLKKEGLVPLTPKQHLEMAVQAGWIPPQEIDSWWILLMCWLEVPEVYEPEQAEALKQKIFVDSAVIFHLFKVLKQKK